MLTSPLRAYLVSGFMLSPSQQQMVLGPRFARIDRRRLLRRSRIRFKCEDEHESEPDPLHAHLGCDGWRESNRGRRIAGASRVGRARFTRSPGPPAAAASAEWSIREPWPFSC